VFASASFYNSGQEKPQTQGGPMATSPKEVTQLLLAWGQGDQAAFEKLVPLVHKELRRLAHHYMAGERRQLTLQTTALVNEAYLRLIDSRQVQWQNRAQFFAISAQLMRRVMVDFARSRAAHKRGGEGHPVSLEEVAEVSQPLGADFVALDEALNALAAFDPRKSKIVELRFFGGLSVEETAVALKLSARTVKREWGVARAWLHRELTKK
jgi:RNA polymerase sigma factor (TIGR02999 family)